VTIDALRAKVDRGAQLNVHQDGPLTVTLADCHGKLESEATTFPG
jgi:hypothetical protein